MESNGSEHNQTLVSENAANSTFRSLLRTGNKTEQLYKENKLLYPTKDFSQLPPKKGIESHIFDTNGPAERIVPGKKIRPIKDNIMFNDDYVETNPNIKYQKRRTNNSDIIQTEPSFNKKNTKFSDELNVNLAKNKNLSRRIRENYGSNPIQILDKEQTNQMNQQNMMKNRRHTEAVSNYLDSSKIKKTFRDIKKNQSENSYKNDGKINNIPASMLKAAIEQKKSEPNFAKKGASKYIVGGKKLSYI